jgi:hypothetical protein
MAIIKKFAENLTQPLTSFGTFVVDSNPNSTYFKITEFKDTFTGGKNGFLIEGSEYLQPSTEIKIEILDVNGDPIYYEPGNGVPEYYEGTSKLVAVYVYEDTPIGTAKITVLGELKTYLDEGGVVLPVPDDWKNVYNVKWEKEFKVNRLLSNEDKVRFYRRPQVTINEIVKPIFNNVTTTIIQTGSLDGIAQSPGIGEQLSGFTAPTTYLLSINDATNWTGSVVGTTISIPSLGYSTLADSVITNKNLLVTNPYTQNNLVSNFSNAGYTASFNYVEGVNNLKTALTGSFAKINISDLTTFVGDVARVKIFRKSQSDLADYQFVQEIRLESNEILRDLESQTKNEEFYGIFDNNNYKEYWVTSSAALTATFNQNYLFNSIQFDSIGVSNFYTSQSLNITNGTEYTLDFNLRVGQGQVSAENYINVFLSGSNQSATNSNQLVQIKQNIITITSDSSLLQKNQLTANFKAEQLNDAKLYFEIKGNGWYIADVSLRASQETAYSPDEITFIQSVPRTLPEETFLYRFEFYDINNNFIPVLVDKSKTFNGGNLQRIQKGLVFTPRSLQFQFDSGSQPVPPTVVGFTVTKNLLTGSVTYRSQSFDFDGNELFSSDYTASFTGQQYPGLLSDLLSDAPTMAVGNFTGSRLDKTVQLVKITGEVEGFEDTVIFSRVLDGFGGVNHLIRPYRGTQIRNSSTASLEVQAIRIDGVNDIELSSTTKPEKGWPDKQLHIISRSADGAEKFVTLEYASSSGYIYGLTTGALGSGEINYNASFNRDSIDFRRTIYLISAQTAASGPAFLTSGSVVASIILEDLQDGLDSGVVTYNADSFTINPRTESEFRPSFAFATASFAKRGTAASEIESVTSSFQVYPSMSINKDWVPEYWLYYHTQSLDPTITVVATDENQIPIPSQKPEGLESEYVRSPLSQTKNLTLTFTYTEPWTSASVSLDKTFTIVPEGKQGDESIVFEVNPIAVTLGANSRGVVNDFIPSITDIRLKQGSRYLAFTASAGVPDRLDTHGTFYLLKKTDEIEYTSSIIEKNVKVGNIHFTSSFGTPYTASLIVSASSAMTDLSGSIEYLLVVHPYYTSSIYTASVVQQYTKVLEGPPPIQILITPQNVTLPANEVGFITSVGYSSANTTIQVKEGEDFLRFTTQSIEPGTWRINSIQTSSIQTGSGTNFTNPLLFDTNGPSSSSFSTATLKFNKFDYPFISASALYTIQVYPFALGAGHQPTSSIFTRTQTFTKNVSVPNARSVDFKASSYTVNYDRNGRVSEASAEPIILSATAFNTTASAANVKFSLFDVALDGSEQFILEVNGAGSPPSAELSQITYNDIGPDTIRTYKVKITDGNTYTSPTVNPYRAESQLTISGVKAGADSYKLVSTNDNCSITADLWTTQFSGSGMKITTFNGTQQLTNANPLPQADLFDTNLDFNNEPIGVLGFSSASIIAKSNYITSPPTLTGNPATVGDITNWVAPAINNAGTIVYRVDFEGDSSTANASIRPLARQTQFVTQSISVQFTPPAPYDVKMTNENTPVVYKVAGNISFDGTGTTIRAYRGNTELINTASFVGPVGGQNDAYGRYGYPNKSRVSILSKSDWISLGGGLVPGQHVPGNPATMPNIIGWANPTTNPTGEIVYQIDCEYSGSLISGSTLFKTQSLAIQYEGAVGPGIVMRGEWSSLIDYIGQVETTNNRRDAVTYLATPDTVKYYAARSGSGPNTGGPVPPTPDGNNAHWEYLGDQEFFVAAKIAIFEESYVKNTINVGTKDGTGAFANIVLAGGRPDPYIAIGQNATVGTSGNSGTTLNPGGSVIGYNRPGIFLGIYEDGGAGTTGRFSIKTTGTSGKGLFWDGDNLTVVGGIRQREPGIPEGSFRGAWAAGVTYYPDDTVTYSGASYINSFTHLSTNDTNIDTGYPPNATNRWTVYAAAGTSGTAGSGGVSGTDGSPGAGVVFRGNFATGNVYYHSAERRDIVRAGSSFFLANNLSLNNNSGSVWGTPPNSNWSPFGAQFSSVATDVLLAQDATITRGLVMGTADGIGGFIRSAGASSLLGGTGFYLDVNGNFRFGQSVSGSNNYVYWNGNDLLINGEVTATKGNIGGFTIADNQLIASGALLRIDTQIPQIEFYTNATGSAKVVLNPKPNLTDPLGNILFVTESKYDGTDGNRTAISGTTPATAFITEVYSGSFGTTATQASPTYTLTGFVEGGVTNFEVYIPETSLTLSGTSPTGNSSYPTFDPTSEYESYYSEYAVGGSAVVEWYLQIFNSTGTTFISEVAITGASTYRNLSVTNNYYQSTGFYPGPYYWNSATYTSPAYYQGNINEGTKAGQINIPSSGTFQFRLVLKVRAYSSVLYDYTGGTNTYYASTATSNHTRTGYVYDVSTFAGKFNFSPNLNKTEITNGGIQVLSNKDAYVRFNRIEPSSYGSFASIADFVGGTVNISAFGGNPAYLDNTGIYMNGRLYCNTNGGNQIGSYRFDAGTGTYEHLQIGGRSTSTVANQSYITSYSNFLPGDDNYYNIGQSGKRWRQIWAGTGTIQTSDATQKFQIEQSPLGLDFINKLQPVSYKFISGSAITEPIEEYIKTVKEPAILNPDGTVMQEEVVEYKKNEQKPKVEWVPGVRKHYGLIAQDVKKTLDEMGISTNDFAGYIVGNLENNSDLGLRYDEFISPMIKAIQELSQKVSQLEAQISGSL